MLRGGLRGNARLGIATICVIRFTGTAPVLGVNYVNRVGGLWRHDFEGRYVISMKSRNERQAEVGELRGRMQKLGLDKDREGEILKIRNGR